MSSTACLVGSSTPSKRRRTIIGRITSRYLPRTYRSRSTSSAMPQMKFAIQFRSPLLMTRVSVEAVGLCPHVSHDYWTELHTPRPTCESKLRRLEERSKRDGGRL